MKGFTFFCQELGHATGTVEYLVDMTNLYIPKPPPFKRYFLTGRVHDSLEMVIRIYKISDLPKDEEGLNQWLRDLWVEKDQLSFLYCICCFALSWFLIFFCFCSFAVFVNILAPKSKKLQPTNMYKRVDMNTKICTHTNRLIDDMLEGKVETKPFYRNPLSSVLHYGFFCIFFGYMFHFVFGIATVYCLIWVITALFPILMIYIERFNSNLHEFLLSADFSLGSLVSASIATLAGGLDKNLQRLENVGNQVRDIKYNVQYNREKVDSLSKADFVSLPYTNVMDNEDDGMDVKSDTELFEPELNDNISNLSAHSSVHTESNNVVNENDFASVTTHGRHNSR